MGIKILKENEEGFGILIEGDAGSVSEVLTHTQTHNIHDAFKYLTQGQTA